MKKPRILRKRYIPEEIVDISSDELLFRDEEIIITKWKAIKPRPDFEWGISFTFLKEGYKISRFFDKKDIFLYWYCDILDITYSECEDEYILKDLLVDVKIMPEGNIMLLDMDELADVTERKIITQEQLIKALRNLSKISEMLNLGKFPPSICLNEKFANKY